MELTIKIDGAETTEDAFRAIAEQFCKIQKEQTLVAHKEELWGNKEVAHFFNVTVTTILRWYKDGDLPPRNKVGKWPASTIKKMAYLK